MSKKYMLLTFKDICMNFLLEFKFFILSHPVTSKQPHKIVQIHMGHPVIQHGKVMNRAVKILSCVGLDNLSQQVYYYAILE